jgi:hypothetical protein
MTDLIPTNVQVPAHLANKIGKPSALAQSLMGGISGGGGDGYPRISIKGARFRIVEDGNETVLDTTALEVVIVGANPRLSKTWYAKEWSKDSEPSAPDCFSLDGVKPHVDSTDPQNDLCAQCPQNAWGSKVTPNGQQIKACADQKRLAIVSADDPTGPVYLLQVTPAALKGLNAYQKELSVRGIAPEIVKTRITFDTDASFPKLKFGFGGFIDEATQEAVDKLFGTDQVKTITGELAPASAPAEVPAIERPAPVVEKAPEPAPAPEAQAEEPVVKRGFGAVKKEAQPAKPKVSEEPKAAPVANGAADDLAAEIAALVGDVSDD